jgi:hypothetical protein
MTLEEIEFELQLAGLRLEEQRMLLSSIKRNGFDAKLLDRKLIGMGYAPIFSIYDDDAISVTQKKYNCIDGTLGNVCQ